MGTDRTMLSALGEEEKEKTRERKQVQGQVVAVYQLLMFNGTGTT